MARCAAAARSWAAERGRAAASAAHARAHALYHRLNSAQVTAASDGSDAAKELLADVLKGAKALVPATGRRAVMLYVLSNEYKSALLCRAAVPGGYVAAYR